MNRDSRTPPLATEPFLASPELRESAGVTEAFPHATEPVPATSTATQVNATQPLLAVTEPAPPRPALADSVASQFQVTESLDLHAAAAAVAEPAAEQALVERTADEPAGEESVVTVEPDICPDIRPPSDSEPLRQLDRLTALVEQELRKSNPEYRAGVYQAAATPSPVEPVSAEEESLQSYLDRFMERVTGKKPESAGTPPVENAVQAPFLQPGAPSPVELGSAAPGSTAPGKAQPDRPVAEWPQLREPARPPECRETLAAMRDLANENARSAVAIHAGLSHWRKTRLTVLAALSASAISSLCAVWHLVTAAPGAIESAVCAGILAGLIACRFFLRCWQMAAPGGKA